MNQATSFYITKSNKRSMGTDKVMRENESWSYQKSEPGKGATRFWGKNKASHVYVPQVEMLSSWILAYSRQASFWQSQQTEH